MARRRTEIRHEEQIIAANVDFLCIVSALDETLTLNLIERYMLLAAEGQAGSFNPKKRWKDISREMRRLNDLKR